MNDDARKRTQPPATSLSETGGVTRSGTRPDGVPAVSQSASASQPYVVQPVGSVPTIHAVVAGYEIHSELGRGAMGVVYKARHVNLNRIVALKMTLGGVRVERKDLVRFVAEAASVASVTHDNVVRVYDYGESGGRPYMALEYCPAGALSDVLREEGALHYKDAAELMLQIAEGVGAAHDQNIIHRDLKPANILLQVEARKAGENLTAEQIAELPLEDLTPKVSDFGLAKRATSDLTATQAVMGTPAYMSPEQAVGKTKFVGPPADVWALGVILYEMLTGKKPFYADTQYEVMAQILSDEPTPVRQLNSKVPDDLELICKKCLEKAAADRYPTAGELADDLDRYIRGEPISVRPLTAVTKVKRWVKRNKAVTALLAVVVLVTLGLMGTLYQSSNRAQAQAESDRKAKDAAEREKASAEQAAQQIKLREEAERVAAQAKVATASAKAQAEQVDIFVNLLSDLFRSSDPLAQFFGDAAPTLGVGGPAEGRAAVLGPFLRTAAEKFKGSLNDPAAALTRAKLLAAIGNGMKALGMYAEARPLLKEALDIRRAKLPETDPAVWQSELDMGRLEGEGGDLIESIARFRKVQELQRKGKADEAVILNAKFLEAMALSVTGMPESGDVLKQVLRDRTALLGRTHRDTVLTKIGLISWLLEHGEAAEVMSLFGEIKEDVKNLPDANLRAVFEPVLDGQVKMATAFSVRKIPVLLRPAIEGLKVNTAKLEKLMPQDHLVLLVMRFVTAQFLVELGEGAEADALFERVRADAKRTVGLAHPRALMLLEMYSKRLADTNRAAEARALFEEMEEANKTRFGPDNPWRTVILLKRARFESKQNNPGKAREAVKAATDLVKREKLLVGVVTLNELYEAARQVGGPNSTTELRVAASELFTALRPLIEKMYGATSNEMMIVLSAEGQQQYESGDREAAAKTLKDGLRVALSLRRLNLDEWANLYYWNGRLAMDRGEYGSAERYFRDAITQISRLPDPPADDRRAYAEYWGHAAMAQGRPGDAVIQFNDARKYIDATAPDLDHLSADARLAAAQLAAKNRAEYDKTLARMVARGAKLTDAASLSRVAWIGGLPASGTWDAVVFEKQFAAALAPDSKDAQAWRGLALVRLRAGKLDEASSALEKAGDPAVVSDHLIRGLLANARGDKAVAKAALVKADALVTDRVPTGTNPYPNADRDWAAEPVNAVLRAELVSAIGTKE